MKTGCSGVFMRKIKWTVVVLAIIAVSVIVLCACARRALANAPRNAARAEHGR